MEMSRGTAAVGAPSPASAPLNAPLFRSIIDGLDERKRWVVLDLGAARNETIALFSRFRCRLDIADLAQDLGSLKGELTRAELERRAEALLPKQRDEATDLVLCWDLLNYLDRPALAALMGRIAARARPGTAAHGLIVYSETQMPTEPGCYVPREDCCLLNVSNCTTLRTAPRYSPEDLTLCMPDYSIERGRLLRNGMQEFLFRL
jgi:hypothetical protein